MATAGISGPWSTPRERPKKPTFDPDPWVVPERDVGRVEELRTKAAAPGVRAATRGIQQAMLKEYRNPNLARLALRDVLGGHGEALSRIYGGAARTAEAQYAPEFAASREKAMADWRETVEREKRRYELELEEYGDRPSRTGGFTPGKVRR